MADPTEYDLEQDSRLSSLEELITPQPKPAPGSEYSFPVVGQDVTDSEYRQMMLAQGNGYIDQHGRGYWLRNIDNTTDTALLTVEPETGDARAVIGGFFHRMIQDMTLSIPPVSETTDYHICLTYNPLESTNPVGPISVKVYAGRPPATSDRAHIILWKGTRKPSQLLSEVNFVRHRQRISPVIYVWEVEHMPDPESVLFGTICVVGHPRKWFRRGGAGDLDDPNDDGKPLWVDLDDGKWVEPGDNNNYVYAGHGYHKGWRVASDGYVELRGHVARANGSNFTPVSSGGTGYSMMSLASAGLPKGALQTFIVNGSSVTDPKLVMLRYDPADQQVRAYPIGAATAWISLDGVRIYMGDR